MSLCYSYKTQGECDTACPGYDNPYRCVNAVEQQKRDARTVDAITYLGLHGVTVKRHHQGIEVNGEYVFSPKSFKWRSLKRNKWYQSKGFADFYERFIKGKQTGKDKK